MMATRISLVLAASVLILTACNFVPAPQEDVTPTVEELEITAPPVEPTASPSPTPTPLEISDEMVETEVMLEPPTETPLPGPPTMPPPPTATPGPYEHVIQPQDTLLYIIQQYGYRDMSVIPEIVAINENIFNADTLPGVGSVILIPRPTVTPTPEGAELTPTTFIDAIAAQALAPTNEQTGLNINTTFMEHVVQEGQTLVDISSIHGITLEIIARLNPDISFFGCNFSVPSGGPNCSPLVRVGQVVLVPAPTPTPTLSPTPSGNETATPTPTYRAPRVVSPPQDALVRSSSFRLEWVSVGVLQPDEVYLVQITDTTADRQYNDITRSTSLMLSSTLAPTDGEVHIINWTVAVARQNESGRYEIISNAPELRSFQWQTG